VLKWFKKRLARELPPIALVLTVFARSAHAAASPSASPAVVEEPVAPDLAASTPTPAPEFEPAPLPPPRGRKLLIAGGATLGASVPVIVIGAILLTFGALGEGQQSPGSAASIPLLSIGVTAFVISFPMIGVGGARYAAWKREHNVALLPRLDRNAHGTWTAGLQLRF
jgi:hypothetical protein